MDWFLYDKDLCHEKVNFCMLQQRNHTQWFTGVLLEDCQQSSLLVLSELK